MSEFARYVFYIPLYIDYSNGIQILWQLAEDISTQRPLSIIPFDLKTSSGYVPNSMKRFVETNYSPEPTDIVVYPESIPGNPLKAKRVCRYVLARPYTLNGQWVNYEDFDYLIYYSKVVGEAGIYLNIQNKKLLNSLTKYINYSSGRRNQVVIYYGKLRCGINLSVAKQLAKRFENIEIITRIYPNSKDDLYSKIANSRLFISLDPLTNLCYESTILGTPVYIADTIFEKEYGDYDFPLHGFLDTKQVLDADFNEFNHAELSMITVKQFKIQVEKNKNLVLKFLSDIEYHFAIKVKTNFTSVSRSDRNFVLNRWGLSPIVSGTNFNSVIGYHLIYINPYIYIGAKAIWRCVIFIRTVPVTLKVYLIGRIKQLGRIFFDFSDPIVSFYLTRTREAEVVLRSKNDFSVVTPNISTEVVDGSFVRGKLRSVIINLIWK